MTRSSLASRLALAVALVKAWLVVNVTDAPAEAFWVTSHDRAANA